MKLPPKITIQDEVKIITLVCYLLKNINGGITEEQLLEIFTVDDLVPQFKLLDALATIENKRLAVLNENSYRIAGAGEEWLTQFEKSLNAPIRRKALGVAKEIIRLSGLKKAVRWSVTQEGGGWVFQVSFLNEMDGADSKLMEIKIYSKTEEGAVKAQEKFLKDPAGILSKKIGNYVACQVKMPVIQNFQ